jgi:hypothetical protein
MMRPAAGHLSGPPTFSLDCLLAPPEADADVARDKFHGGIVVRSGNKKVTGISPMAPCSRLFQFSQIPAERVGFLRAMSGDLVAC